MVGNPSARPAEALRVAFVLRSGGRVGRHVRMLVEGLCARGWPVEVFCPPATADQIDFGASGARVTVAEVSAPGPRDLARLGRRLRDAQVDVIHAHGLRAGLAAQLTRPAGVPLVVTWHTPAPGRGVRRLARDMLARTVARGADMTLCASLKIQKEATESGADDARLMMVVAPPLPAPRRTVADVREELGLPTDAPMILSVGRLDEQKRHDILIAAAARWRDLRPAPAVIIAGKGPRYRDLVGQVAQTRAPVHLIGHRDDIADLLRAADLAVVTSVAEGSPSFVQEALASGAALVATAVNGVAEMVGDAAVLVPPDDVDAVARAVRALVGDAYRRAVLAAAGPALAAGWPSPADTLNQIISIYGGLRPRHTPGG